ncbi:hypothetical protein HY745_04320 [Candidatus Desantisbacteria bacterium]|nr:hypothetical protein [Candidatus Desantisbacteria bacterium]
MNKNKKTLIINLTGLFLFTLTMAGCSGAKVKSASYAQTYSPITNTTRFNGEINNSYSNSKTSVNLTNSNSNNDLLTKKEKINIDNRNAIDKKDKKAIIQTSSVTSTDREISKGINDLILNSNRYVVFKNISKYFGERKIKSILYAVGDFNKWGKDSTAKYPVKVENDEAKLDLYELPLLKGTNRVGFADFSGNLWQVNEELHDNKLIVQSTTGSWVIGLIVTKDGTVTPFNINNIGKKKLIPER